MLVWLSSLALAARDPVPAQLVERGLLVPCGATTLDLGTVTQQGADALVARRLPVVLGYGVLPRLSLSLDSGVGWTVGDRIGDVGVLDVGFGATARLFRREVDNVDLVVSVDHQAATPFPATTPISTGLPRSSASFAARRRAGPFLGTVTTGIALWGRSRTAFSDGLTVAPTPFAAADALLQVGPIALTGGVAAEHLGARRWADGRNETGAWLVDAAGGLVAQVTRGFSLTGSRSGPLYGGAPFHPALPRGGATTLAAGFVW